MKILLLGGGLQGLSCGESFQDKGWTVDVVSNELQIRKSVFFRFVYSKDYDPSNDSILNLLSNCNYDIIIPMGDASAYYLSQNKEIIESKFGCKCACPNVEIIERVVCKRFFMDFCEKYQIPHPKTCLITDTSIDECARKIGFPSLIKPDFSVGARGITRVSSIDELSKKYSFVKKKYGSCTLQEFIENEEYYYNVIIYRNKEGHVLGHTISKIVRMYPIHAGSSSCLVTVENDELLQICKDCLDKLNWVGIANFDVLQRLDNKEYKIIEINARVPASLRAAIVSGVDFPEMIVLDAIGMPIPQYNYTPGKIVRFIGTDILWLMKSSKRFHSSPPWFRFIGNNIYYQDIYFKDKSTWWTWLVQGLIKLMKR